MGHTTACNERPKTSYQVRHAPAQGLTNPTMPLDPLSTFKFTLHALSTQLATTQLPRSELERALNLLNSIDTMVSKATSRGEFELFLKLPIELRLRIWQYAAWHPRVIAIKDDYNPTHMALCGSNARCPLVRVNKEAREEVVKIKIDFNARCQIDGAPKIWVNLAVDTIVRVSHTCEYAVFHDLDLWNHPICEISQATRPHLLFIPTLWASEVSRHSKIQTRSHRTPRMLT